MAGARGSAGCDSTENLCETATSDSAAIRGATLRDLLWRGHLVLFLPARLAATAQGRPWRCLGSVVGRRARTQTYANRPFVPKNFVNAVTELFLYNIQWAVDTKNS